MARRSVNTTDLIPIYYRIPFGYEKEIVSGYLEKKHVDNGKRFYGHFRCEDCGHDWRSGHTWQGYRQECRKCEKKNWPEKVYHLEQSTGPISAEPHREDLCEKCQKLGHNCQETHGFGGIGSGRNNKFDQCFNKQFELWRYNILLEPQFIQDLYDSLWDDLNPSDRSEFKDALEFALGNWKAKGNDDQITACEDLLCQIEDASQRKSRTRKRSASSNRSLSPMDPGTIHNTCIPLNNDAIALKWYDEDTSPRSSLSSGSTAPNQQLGSSPRIPVRNTSTSILQDNSVRETRDGLMRDYILKLPDTAEVIEECNQTTSQIPVTRTNRDEHSTPQLKSNASSKPKATLVTQSSNPPPQPNKNPSSRPKNNPVAQPNKNPSSRPKNNPAAQPNKNPSSRPKNNPPPQPNKNPSSRPKNSLIVEPVQDPVHILSMLTMLILAVAMLVYFTV